MPGPILEVSHLTCRYGPVVAVSDVSFTVSAGEVLGFLGPNGAGKSTTLRALCGLHAPAAGSVTVAGHDLDAEPRAAKRRLGYLPEQPPLYAEMTVGEYLRFCARLRGLAEDAAERVTWVMDACDVAGFEGRLLGSLSKGARQRVGIAQALVHDPALVVLDEPTVGLDPIQIREIRDLIRRLGRERAIILSTHLLPEVREICDRVLILHRGRIVLASTMARFRGGGDARSLRVAFRHPPPLTELQALTGVVGVEAGADGEMRLRCDDPERAAAAVVSGSAGGGWGLATLVAEETRLEDVFVALTCTDPGTDPGADPGADSGAAAEAAPAA